MLKANREAHHSVWRPRFRRDARTPFTASKRDSMELGGLEARRSVERSHGWVIGLRGLEAPAPLLVATENRAIGIPNFLAARKCPSSCKVISRLMVKKISR